MPVEKFYYIYSWYDPRDGKPIYIGKGTQTVGIGKPRFARANRVLQPNCRFDNSLLRNICNKIKHKGLIIRVKIHSQQFITLEDVHSEEMRLIKKIGRRNLGTGTLCNLTDGGDGTVALVMSAKSLAKVTQRMNNYQKDKAFQKKRMAALMAVLMDSEYRAKNSAATTKRNFDPEFQAKASRSPERRAAQSALIKSQRQDVEFNKKHAEAMRKFHREHPDFQSIANSPENRAKQSKRSKLKWQTDTAYRLKMLAQNMNPSQQPNLKRHMEYLRDVWGIGTGKIAA